MFSYLRYIFAVVGFVCAGWVLAAPDATPEKRILFIGNSFTYAWSVPLQVKAIAASAEPAAQYHVEVHAHPGATLRDHLDETGVLDVIQAGAWDVVVLQDASYMAFHDDTARKMMLAIAELAPAIAAQGAEVLYYAHWAPEEHRDAQAEAVQRIEQTYSVFGLATESEIARAGRLWQMAEAAGMEGLYADDGHHASLKGAYAAALAIAAALGDVDPGTSTWAPEGVDWSDAKQLRALAALLPQGAQVALR